MKHAVRLTIALLLLLTGVSAFAQSVPQSMNFQGRLAKPDGTPLADGTYAITFSIYNAPSGGTLLWQKSIPGIKVRNGAFATLLDYSGGYQNGATLASVFIGSLVYLDVSVNGGASLAPRQPLVSNAYAFTAQTALGVAAGSITGAGIANGTITADKFAPNILNPLAWLLGGNSGTNPAANFLGTTDNHPLVLKANNRQVMRYADVADAGNTYHAVNMLGGAAINSILTGVVGATIAGGGKDNNTGADSPNEIDGDFGFIGGGSGNFIDAFTFATIGGGSGNIVQGNYSFIGGGSGNNAQGLSNVIAGGDGNYTFYDYATVGGGYVNSATSDFATVGGGESNRAIELYATVGGGNQNTASGDYAVVGGGTFNSASGGIAPTVAGGYTNVASSNYATIGGGNKNTASGDTSTIGGGETNMASAAYATVGGGVNNAAAGSNSVVAGGNANNAYSDNSAIGGGSSNQTAGLYATVPGGDNNFALGQGSFAAGSYAVTNYDGSFVWADNQNAYFEDSAANQFCIRAYGGIVLETGQNAYMFTASTSGEKNRYMLFLNSPQTVSASGVKAGGILCADDFGYSNPGKSDMTVKGKLAVGYDVNTTGGYRLAVSGTTFSFGGYFGSDARYKKNIVTLNNSLESVLALRGVSYEWNKAKFPNLNFGDGRQMGFIAQEVEQIFPELVVTAPDGYKAVNYVGVVPVLVEAVKMQQKQMDDKQKQLDAQKREIDELKAQVREIDALKKQNERITALEKQLAALLAAQQRDAKK